MGGLSGSLNIFLLTAAIISLQSKNIFKPLIIGFISGLLYINRFDNALLIIAIFIIYSYSLISSKKNNAPVELIKLISSFILVISPLIIINYHRFGIPFISDNSLTFKSIKNLHATFYFTEPILTISNYPKEWILKVLNNFNTLIYQLLNQGYFYGLSVIFIAFCSINKNTALIPKKDLGIFFWCSLLIIIILSATGYSDPRYLIPAYFFGTLIICCQITSLKWWHSLILVVLIGVQVRFIAYSDHLFFYSSKSPPTLPEKILDEESILNSCLELYGARSVMPFFKDSSEGQIISFFGTSSKYKVLLLPGNIKALTKNQFLDLVSKFRVDAIYERSAQYPLADEEFPILCKLDPRIKIRKDFPEKSIGH